MKRLERLALTVDERLKDVKKSSERFQAIKHLNGVAEMGRLLALRRGLDEDTLYVAGLLHDLWSYEYDCEDNHAKEGAKHAKKILKQHDYSDKEIKIITEAIANHSDKGREHGEYAEALKDADVLHHFLQEPYRAYTKVKVRRIKTSMRDLGIHIKVKKK